MTKKIICLTSVRGRSGKDTLIDLLVNTGHDVARVAFGDCLKEECAKDLATDVFTAEDLLGFFHSDAKDQPMPGLAIKELPSYAYKWFLMVASKNPMDPHYFDRPRTPRWHLQQYGTNFRRDHLKNPNVWLDAGMKIIKNTEAEIIVVSDMRQRNEYNNLRLYGQLTGSTVKLVRLQRLWNIPGVDDAPYHVTDLDLIGHQMDAVVLNEWGNPEAMLDQLKTQGVI